MSIRNKIRARKTSTFYVTAVGTFMGMTAWSVLVVGVLYLVQEYGYLVF